MKRECSGIRAALIPNGVAMLASGHSVIIEKGAGKRSFYNDEDYSGAGAEVTSDRKKSLKPVSY
ncbi:MAG: hypothetical protein IPF93_14275 [Saprospiraceae bacterium]|nr:hypothetical protein [Saprospiraceae bacterium]